MAEGFACAVGAEGLGASLKKNTYDMYIFWVYMSYYMYIYICMYIYIYKYVSLYEPIGVGNAVAMLL